MLLFVVCHSGPELIIMSTAGSRGQRRGRCNYTVPARCCRWPLSAPASLLRMPADSNVLGRFTRRADATYPLVTFICLWKYSKAAPPLRASLCASCSSPQPPLHQREENAPGRSLLFALLAPPLGRVVSTCMLSSALVYVQTAAAAQHSYSRNYRSPR